MEDLALNIVDKLMAGDGFEPLSPAGQHTTVTWSKPEIPGADVYFYVNSFSLSNLLLKSQWLVRWGMRCVRLLETMLSPIGSRRS